MKSILTLVALVACGVAIASDRYIGTYSTVSESECNQELNLARDRTGTLQLTCRREDGSNIDDVEVQKVTWQIDGTKIYVRSEARTVVFQYYNLLPCDSLGNTGAGEGLVGYGSKFWKQPIRCE